MLVFSVDPQASLSDIFKRDIFGKGPVEIMPNLYAQEIDADQRIKEYQEEIRQKILRHVRAGQKSPKRSRTTSRPPRPSRPWKRAPSSTRWWISSVGGEYDYYIYDLVPLGHALYYLSMASVYDQWIDKITALRTEMEEYAQVAAVMQRNKESEEDQILKELQYIKHRINTSSGILTDKQKTAFFFVVIPEEMIILDTKKAAGLFAKFDVPLVRLHRQPRHPARAGAAGHPRLPAQPPGDAEEATWPRSTRSSAARCWPTSPSSSATSPACP